MGLARRDALTHTFGEYRTWPDEARYELIDGVAYCMSPAPTPRHQDLAGAIYVQLYVQLAGGPCRAFVSPVDVLLPRADEADDRVDTVVQPDVLVLCDPSRLRPKFIRGAPDFVVEVLSPSTASHDMVLKRRAYERAGVRELWLVHPVDRVLTAYRLEGVEFGRPHVQALAGETALVALPGVVIAWDEAVARLPPIED